MELINIKFLNRRFDVLPTLSLNSSMAIMIQIEKTQSTRQP
jgi:hypothetical protein